MTTLLFGGSALLAFALAAALTPLVARLAQRVGMLDIPGGRRLHPRPIPRPGGLAIALAFGLTIAAFWFVDRISGGPFLIPEEVRSSRFTLTALAALLGVTLGFLLFNFHPARLFMGSTGVVFVGTMLAVLSIFGTAKVAAALLVLGVPIIDTFYVLVRRVLQRQPPFAPDRGHFHHRLLDVGLSHAQAVLIIYALPLGFGTLAFVTTGRTQVLAFVGAVVLFGVAVVVLTQRSSKAKELDPALYADEADRI